MARINTTKMLSNDGFFNGGLDTEVITNQKIEIHPEISSQYESSVTTDPDLLLDREDTLRRLYDIYIESSIPVEYVVTEGPLKGTIKIPKDDIKKVFYYMKQNILKVKKLSAAELVMSICYFFDFDYKYIFEKVLSKQLLAEILNDYYCNGMAPLMDEDIMDQVF